MSFPFLAARILVVDDQQSNVTLLERFLEKWGYENVTATTDPQSALKVVRTTPVDLLLLDLQMPSLDGYDVMEALGPLRQGAHPLPILVLTADLTPETRLKALGAGADDFLVKPFDPGEVRIRVGNLLHTRKLQLEIQAHNTALEQRVRHRTADLERSRLEVIDRLALAAEYRDDDTHQHAYRVGRTAALLAERIGLPPTAVQVIRRAAPLHDVGKIGVSDAILRKPGKLTADEFATMQTHVSIGARILSGSTYAVLQTAEEIALTHHEHWNGRGYPKGLTGTEIPISGQVTAVADVFDALTHRRPYKDAWPIDKAADEIRRLAGTQFAPDVVTAFDALDHAQLLAPILPGEDEHVDTVGPGGQLTDADASITQAIFTASPDAMLIADDARRYIEANPAACALLGIDREAILKLRIDDLLGAQTPEAIQDEWEGFLRDGIKLGEMTLKCPNNSPRTVQFHAVANFLPGRHLSILRRQGSDPRRP